MKIVLACDHAAFEGKEALKSFLVSHSHDVIDVGTNSNERCDYPDYGYKGAQEVIKHNCVGIFLCGSGIGISIAANRFKGIRAALCYSVEAAKLSRQHNDANVLCLGARLSSTEDINQIVSAWLATSFEGGRHADRVLKLSQWGSNA